MSASIFRLLSDSADCKINDIAGKVHTQALVRTA